MPPRKTSWRPSTRGSFPATSLFVPTETDLDVGNTYPSLDGHQMSEALLWLGKVEVVKSNWDYVRSFQRPNGHLPLAILPSLAGQPIGSGDAQATVDANGGLYKHWVPGNPLAALASPTFIQNADVIYRHTLDRGWLEAQIDSVNRAADYLTTLTTPEGIVRGAGYYVERPTRIDSDGVAQCYAVDAFRRAAALNRVLGQEAAAVRYGRMAERIRFALHHGVLERHPFRGVPPPDARPHHLARSDGRRLGRAGDRRCTARATGDLVASASRGNRLLLRRHADRHQHASTDVRGLGILASRSP